MTHLLFRLFPKCYSIKSFPLAIYESERIKIKKNIISDSINIFEPIVPCRLLKAIPPKLGAFTVFFLRFVVFLLLFSTELVWAQVEVISNTKGASVSVQTGPSSNGASVSVQTGPSAKGASVSVQTGVPGSRKAPSVSEQDVKKVPFMQILRERREANRLRKKKIQSFGTDQFPQDSEIQTSSTGDFSYQESSWARFMPGSWCRIRTRGTAFQKFKKIESVTETTLTLEAVDEVGYTLKKEVAIKVGPNFHKRTPEFVRYDFMDVPIDEKALVESLGTDYIQISSRTTPCQKKRITKTTAQFQEEMTLYYSSVLAPHILRKDVNRYALSEDKTTQIGPLLSSSVMTVMKTSAHALINRNFTVYNSITTVNQGGARKSTKTVHNMDIPGGVSRETVLEWDQANHLVYQSNSQISEFHIER